MSNSPSYDQTFYDQRVWGNSEINLDRKGIDVLKLERLLESGEPWPGKSCLGIGCGTGRYLRGLAKLLPPSVSLAGCDISGSSLAIAASLTKNIEYRQMEDTRTPWPDETFDMVCFLDVMEHVESPSDFLAESLRVLKKGGIFHASVPMEGDFRSLWRWFDFIGLHDQTKRLDGQIQRFTKRSLKKVFTDAGMEQVSEFYSYQLVGNVLDFALFNWLNIRRKFGYKGSHYEIVAASRSRKGSLLGLLGKAADSSMYWEGRWLGRYAGMNAHLTYRRIR